MAPVGRPRKGKAVSSSHSSSKASPRSTGQHRMRSESNRPVLQEKDTSRRSSTRRIASSSSNLKKHAVAQRTYTTGESDGAESTDYVDSDAGQRKKESLLKRNKAKLRAQNPDDDLFNSSSSSDTDSSSDAVQVVITRVSLNACPYLSQ